MQCVSDELFLKVVNDAVNGEKSTLELRLRQVIRKLKKDSPDLAKQLDKILQKNTGAKSLRGATEKMAAPVDSDSRQKLLKETYTVLLDFEPILSTELKKNFDRFIKERDESSLLIENGLFPSKSLLFNGPPGVGKTISAQWIAQELDLPLLTLDLASVISSYLGKTGNNIRSVLNYAQSFSCVLLLDEFDAIAKKRDDDSDVGELKRLVTVLLQAIDEWPHTSVLIAATNHGDLLDPAVWRRFDRVMTFEYPTLDLIMEYLERFEIELSVAELIAPYLKGKSFADIERTLKQSKRNAVIENVSFYRAIFEELDISSDINVIVNLLNKKGMPQVAIAKSVNKSRSTVRRILDNQK